MVPEDHEAETWEYPGGATLFQGGWTFGSSLYDAELDGISVEIIVCDECLTKYKANIREMDNHLRYGKRTKVCEPTLKK